MITLSNLKEDFNPYNRLLQVIHTTLLDTIIDNLQNDATSQCNQLKFWITRKKKNKIIEDLLKIKEGTAREIKSLQPTHLITHSYLN